MLINVAS
jgi:hypothetical protein